MNDEDIQKINEILDTMFDDVKRVVGHALKNIANYEISHKEKDV